MHYFFNEYTLRFEDILENDIKEQDDMNQTKIEELSRIVKEDYGNTVGLIVKQDGRTLYENYFNGYSSENAVHVFSVTKSVFSALIGIAVGRGLIESVQCKVLDFFPDYELPAFEKTAQNITIENLLTMTAPYKYDTEPYELFFTSLHPIRDALDLLGGEKQIGKFNYSAIGGTHILSGVLAKATGRPVLDFANENLFLPLGIHVPQSIFLRSREEHFAVMGDKNTVGWAADPQGFNTASWGLFLKPADMVKIGLLYLSGGVWDGMQVVPAEWIRESTAEHSHFGRLAYGYLWWIVDHSEHSFAALGDGGNVIYVNEKKKLTVAIASLFVPDAKDRIALIREHIEPLLAGGMN